MPDERAAEAVRRVAEALRAAGVEAPQRDARLLVASAIAASPAALLLHPERVLVADEVTRLDQLTQRRVRREPISRILGAREFYGRSFELSPATLDPRPCSETLVSAVLELADETGGRQQPRRILDVGTGSGALIVTLVAELPGATGVGTDVSPEALAVARRNAQLLGVGGRVVFEERRSLVGRNGPFDLLVSNPPYIAASDIPGLEPEVRDWDPRLALDGGADGLQIYRELAAGLGAIVPHGWAVFEVGAGQAEAVEDILRQGVTQRPQAKVRTWRDLAGHTRCVAIETQL